MSRKIDSKELVPEEVIIHEAVMAELESQANKNRETGYAGLEEVKRIRELGESPGPERAGFKVSFKGSRPTDFEIRYAKAGEIDSLIRKLAIDENATLITADKVQSLVAESKGLSVILFEYEQEENPFVLEKYFCEGVLSVFLREGFPVKILKGKPGDSRREDVSEPIDRESMKALAKGIIDEANSRTDSVVEIDRKGFALAQFKDFRVVISRPPLSDVYEISCHRVSKAFSFQEYGLVEEQVKHICEEAKGVLIAGVPGCGKTSLVSSLVNHLHSSGRLVKTAEASRDAPIDKGVSRYSDSQSSNTDLLELLLQGRPDVVLLDDLKSGEDFRLFSDLRFSGVRVLGVLDAGSLQDALWKTVSRLGAENALSCIDTIVLMDQGVPSIIAVLRWTCCQDNKLGGDGSPPGSAIKVIAESIPCRKKLLEASFASENLLFMK
ncbi:Flp pilus assembly complex ATPase component TadA [Candidatus Woesearchaeota archaeon]|nr:Flp pilus assembly complex ATPase component TadA [Candidatus Woesearchaeota archaeon]